MLLPRAGSTAALPLLVAAFASSFLFATAADAQDADPPAATPDADPENPSAATPPASTDARRGDKDEKDAKPEKDDDLGLEWVWLNADLGYSYADLKSAKLAISPAGGTPITVVDASNSGLVYGFGAGIRLLFLTVGLRARNLSAMNLWQIDGEVGFHGRIGHVDPYLAARFGYDTVGTLSQSVTVAGSGTPPPDVSVHGWNGGLALGLDYYFMHALSLGGEVAGNVFFLQRPAASPPALTAAQQAAIKADTSGQLKANYQKIQDAYQASASSVGYGAAFTVHVGVHF